MPSSMQFTYSIEYHKASISKMLKRGHYERCALLAVCLKRPKKISTLREPIAQKRRKKKLPLSLLSLLKVVEDSDKSKRMCPKFQ